MYQYNVPYRGRPEDRVYRRELRPRRTRSEDPRSNREFIDNTLNEIRRKQSVQTGNEMQMSCEEIDLLLNTIRRSRSQSQTKDELNNNQPYRPAEAAKNSTKLDPPPPPQSPPPPLPATSTPFGDALSNNWSPMTRRSRTPRSLKTTSLYCQGSTQTTKELLNMPEKNFWQIGHCLSGERDKRSSPPLSVSKTKQTFETVSNMDQKSSDDFGRQAPEALSETSNHDVSLKNSTNIEDRVQIPTCMYYNHTPYPSDASPEDHGASADRNFNEYAETSVGGSASPNAHYHTNEQVCITDIEPGTTNIKSHRFDLTRSGCEVKSQSSHQVTGLDELKLETHPDITMGTDSESHNQNNLLNISLQDPKTIDKNCQKKGGDVLWNNNPAYQPTTAGSSSKLKDNKDQTKTGFADLTKKKFFNVSDIHEIQNITSPEKEPDDKELQREVTRSVDIPDLENYAENVEDRVAKNSAEMFQKECADIEQDAFRLVNDLRERLSDMTLELEKVKAATEQLNHNIHELSSDEDSAYEPYQTTEEPLVFYTVEEPLEISKDDYFSKGTSSVVIDDMSQEQTTMSPLFTRSKHVLPKPIVIQRIHPPFIGNTDNKAPIHSAGLKSKSQPSQTFADDGHFQASNWRYSLDG